MAEGPTQNAENIPTAESREVAPFSIDLRALRRILGDQLEPIPANASDEELAAMEMDLKKDLHFQTFHEQFRSNELIHTYNSLQRQKELKTGQQVNMPEFVVVNQARTYYEYFPIVLEHVVSLMEEYEELRAGISSIPEPMRKKEGQARLYIQALERAVRERVDFANVLLIDSLVEKQFIATPEDLQQALALRKSSQEKLNVLDSQESFDVLNRGNHQEIWNRGNALNQRIIDILAGTGGIEGAPDGFFPQQLLLDLLAHRYAELVEEQQHLARDPYLANRRDRFEELLRRNDLAHAGKGKPLTVEEGEEYRKLQSLIHSRIPGFAEKSERRRELMRDLVEVTEQLGEYHLQMEELVSIQHHFGEHFDFEGAKPSTPDQTPNAIRAVIAKNIDLRQKFHLERMEGYLKSFDANVLGIGAAEITEDFWNEEGGRDFVVSVNDRIADLITFPLPEQLGMRDWARNRLKEPLKEAVGWPSDKINIPFEDLPKEDRDRIAERAKSILSAIREYDRTPMEQLHSSIAAAHLLNERYPASEYVGQKVQDPLPVLKELITAENLGDMVDQYGAPTVYFLLFDQCDNQWGSIDPPSGFMGVQAKLFEKINTNIDVHLDVGRALHQLGRQWENYMYYLLAAAVVSFAAGAVTMRYAPRMARSGTRLAWRATMETLRKTGGALNRLRQGVGVKEALKGAASRIAQFSRNSSEAAQALRGASALHQAGISVNSILLVHEGYQAVRLWREIGILAKNRDVSDLIVEAERLKKPLLWWHAGATTLDAGAVAVLSTHALSNGAKLAFVGSMQSVGIGLIVVPVGMTIRNAMHESIAAHNLQQKAKLKDRVDGYDEMALGRSTYEQLWGLGRVPLTLSVGAALSKATLSGMENMNLDERQEVVIGLTLSHLRHIDPHEYEILLEQLVDEGRAMATPVGLPEHRTINSFRYHTFVKRILLPFIGMEIVRRVEQGHGNKLLEKEYKKQLSELNIRKGLIGSYISETDLQSITLDAAKILKAWVHNHEDISSVEDGRRVAKALTAETMKMPIELVRRVFGRHAERVLAMPPQELKALRARHAQACVDILYHESTALPGLLNWRKKSGVDFADDKNEGIALIADRLKALNQYLLVAHHIPWLHLQPAKQYPSEVRVSSDEAFYEADGYRVTDQAASHYKTPLHLNSTPHITKAMLKRSSMESGKRDAWRRATAGRYRSLLDEFSA